MHFRGYKCKRSIRLYSFAFCALFFELLSVIAPFFLTFMVIDSCLIPYEFWSSFHGCATSSLSSVDMNARYFLGIWCPYGLMSAVPTLPVEALMDILHCFPEDTRGKDLLYFYRSLRERNFLRNTKFKKYKISQIVS